MDITAGPDAEHLNFAQFYQVYAALNIMSQLQQEDLRHLEPDNVKAALRRAGVNPTKAQLEQMFVLGDKYNTYDKLGSLNFIEFLRIYVTTPVNHHEHFLHSWYAAGRNSMPYNRPVEISPFHDFVAGTAAGVALTVVGHPFDTVKVRLQTEKVFKGGLQCLLETIQKEGIRALYKG